MRAEAARCYRNLGLLASTIEQEILHVRAWLPVQLGVVRDIGVVGVEGLGHHLARTAGEVTCLGESLALEDRHLEGVVERPPQ